MKRIVVLIVLISAACNRIDPDLKDVNFREEMRTLVSEISIYAKAKNPKFIIIPQNGIELVTLNGDPQGQVAEFYIDNIDAVGQEDLFYGYEEDNQKSPIVETNYLVPLLDIVADNGKVVLVTDYCSDPSKMDDSYVSSNNKGYISFAAPERELSIIPAYPPAPRDSNERDIFSINDASNFLYLINPENYSSKEALLFDLAATNFDVILMDGFFDDEIWRPLELEALKTKYNGGKRLLISYLSIGEAENYRYYWEPGFANGTPEWLSDPNPDWPGNYKVKYWMDSWKSIIYRDTDAYLDQLLEAGFDGAYLDIIDAYEYFEDISS